MIPHSHHVHIMHEGHNVPADEDEDKGFVGKRMLGDAGCSSLRHFASAYGTDELNIELFTSLDLHSYRLVGTDEERQFKAGVYPRICMPKTELLLCNELVDHFTEDLEVTDVRDIMLVRATRRCHGHVETRLLEWVEKLEKCKEGLVTANKELKAQIESLEATITKNKNKVE